MSARFHLNWSGTWLRSRSWPVNGRVQATTTAEATMRRILGVRIEDKYASDALSGTSGGTGGLAFEGDAQADVEQVSGMAVGALDVIDERCEHVHGRERIRDTTARPPIVVLQQPIVLEQPLRRVHFTRKLEISR